MALGSDLKRVIYADLHRYTERQDTLTLVKTWLTAPGFQYTAMMRACRALESRGGRATHILALLVLRRFERRWGISIPPETDIGEGLYIGHFGGIVVNPAARIGRNCNIQQGVTIGRSNRGQRQGVPVIGDRVWIGPGAKILGAVTIGDNVVIGANCVVATDIAANSVIAAERPKVISDTAGADGYINRTLP